MPAKLKKNISELVITKAQSYLLGFCIFFNVQIIFSQNTDINLLRDINLHRNTELDNSFKFLSNTMVPVSIGVPVITTGIGLIKKDKKIIDNGLETGASLIISAAFTYSLKYAVNRDRPYITYHDIQNQSTENDPSFPSGHASSSFAIATSLSLEYKKWYVAVPAYTWAGGVSYSRMHIGVHYPSDVLTGAIIGAGSAYLCHKGRQWINKKRNYKSRKELLRD